MNEPMTYEEYLQLLELGGNNADLSNAIAQQQQQAEWLRTEAPRMRGDRVQTAPNALELLGGLARNKVSFDLEKVVREQQKKQAAQQTQQNQMIMQAILRGNQPQQPAPFPAPAQDPYTQFRQPGAI